MQREKAALTSNTASGTLLTFCMVSASIVSGCLPLRYMKPTSASCNEWDRNYEKLEGNGGRKGWVIVVAGLSISAEIMRIGYGRKGSQSRSARTPGR